MIVILFGGPKFLCKILEQTNLILDAIKNADGNIAIICDQKGVSRRFFKLSNTAQIWCTLITCFFCLIMFV